MKTKLQSLPRGSKAWWRLSRRLALDNTSVGGVAHLKDQTGEWQKEGKAKADLLAKTFQEKYVLSEGELNEYSDVPMHRPDGALQGVNIALLGQLLGKLKVDSATGPDLLPSRILKALADALAEPMFWLTKQILLTRKWPDAWRNHWIVPLHKRKAVCNPGNYRGVHLTPHASKVVERALLAAIQEHIQAHSLFGENQFAYSHGRGCRDAIAYLTLTWIQAFDRRQRIGVFCSDVQGAFDRVSIGRMCGKLHASGLPADLVGVLCSWLEARAAHVLVDGEASAAMKLQDMVFQGTVLGPTLWNIFFADSCRPIRDANFEEVVFADDLNAFRCFDAEIESEKILTECAECQKKLHTWGKANRVSFDPSKESIHVMGRAHPVGEGFKILGIQYDLQLLMGDCIDSVCADASWKLKAILRVRRFHSDADMVIMYKARLLSFIEYRTPAVYHACTSRLIKIDKLQDAFLRALGLSREDGLSQYNLAPLQTRRDIAMLGVIHRSVLGVGPPHLDRFQTQF